MSGFLQAMASASAARILPSIGALMAQAGATPPPPRLTLRGFDLIAEVKRTSPSEGALRSGVDGAGFAAQQAARYQSAGAAAISILTEPTRFGGDLADLSAAAAVTTVPVMRKDFLVSAAQVVEARAAGAGGVLLIARILDDAQLAELLAVAAELRLFVLLEAFDVTDLRRCGRAAHGSAAEVLVGLNSRDLTTLAVEPDRLTALADHLPAGLPAVAESGLLTPADAAVVSAAGYAAALVGSALMRTSTPESLAADMITAGRAARGTSCS